MRHRESREKERMRELGLALGMAMVGLNPDDRGLDSWAKFSAGMRDKSRIHPVDPAFTRELISEVASHTRAVDVETQLFRARINPPALSGGVRSLGPEDMGMPPNHLAPANRLNASGIPHLYLAEQPETAVAEVRPWRSALVTVGTWRAAKALQLVDLEFGGLPKGASGAMQMLAVEVSRPAHAEDSREYAATQFISDCIRKEGFDGIRYGSALRPLGINVVLFSQDFVANCTTERWEVSAVSVETSPEVNYYKLSKQRKRRRRKT